MHRFSWRPIGLSLFIGVTLASILLFMVSTTAQAIRMGSGAFGCGNLVDAIQQVPEGETIVPMVPPRVSESALITRSIAIQGGWTRLEGNCPEPNFSITDTTGLRDNGFVYLAPITRSALTQDISSVLRIDLAAKYLLIEHMDLENTDPGDATDYGAGISGILTASAEMRLNNVVIHDSGAATAGGGLYLELYGASRLLIENSQFIGNAAVNGGGLELHLYDDSDVTIVNTLFDNNRTTAIDGDGAAGRIVMHGGSVHIIGSTFSQNDAGSAGGALAIEMDGGTVTIDSTTFSSQEANAGGALYVESIGDNSAYVTIRSSSFSNNNPNDYEFKQTGTGALHTSIQNQTIYLPIIQNSYPPMSDYAQITGITLNENWQYEVAFETFNFTPQLPGEHVHFFFNTVAPEDAGVPGSGPWKLYGGSSPFTGYTDADRPTFATHLCILVANPDHSVQPDSGNCMLLPTNQNQ